MRTLFDTYDERHAFVIGLGEGFNYLPPRVGMTDQVKAWLNKEYWYYAAGRSFGLAIHLFVLAYLIKFCVR